MEEQRRYYTAWLVVMCLTNLVTLTLSASNSEALYSKESELLSQLLNSTYNKAVNPQVNASVPVIVGVSFRMVSILDINEKEGYLMATFNPVLSWVDERLSWEKNDEHPFDKLNILASSVWTPDMEIFNSMHSSPEAAAEDHKLFVYSNGTVYYTPHLIIKTPCQFNLESFPYDTHHCHILYGSGSANSKEISFTAAAELFLASYMEHQEWTLQKVTSKVENEWYPTTLEEYSHIHISITISRKGSYYYRLFVAPAAVCMFVIPIIHFTPPSSNEKLTLSGLILVGCIVMFEMLEDFFPPFSVTNVPLLLHYYTMLLILLFMSMLLSCLSVMIGTGDTKSKRVPRFLRKFCIDKLGYICCARGRTTRYDYELLHLEKALRYSAAAGDNVELRDTEEIEDDTAAAADSDGSSSNNTSENKGMQEVLKSLVNELQYARYKEQVKSEWAQLAIVLDRTGGLILLVLALVMTAIISVQTKL